MMSPLSAALLDYHIVESPTSCVKAFIFEDSFIKSPYMSVNTIERETGARSHRNVTKVQGCNGN